MADPFNQLLSGTIDLAQTVFLPKTGAQETASTTEATTPTGTTQQPTGTTAGTGATAFGAGAQLPMVLLIGGSILLVFVLIKAIK